MIIARERGQIDYVAMGEMWDRAVPSEGIKEF
jgi:hypothetical protein